MLVNELILKLQEMKAENGNVKILIHLGDLDDEEVDVIGVDVATKDGEPFLYIW